MAEDRIVLPGNEKARILKWKIAPNAKIGACAILGLYQPVNSTRTLKLKCSKVGTVKELVAKEGDLVKPGDVLVTVALCTHGTVMKDMCADCGADLRQEGSVPVGQAKTGGASIAMVHSVPELVVSEQQAIELGKADEDRLLKSRKLVLLVDLDQTLLHTTNDNIPPNLKDVYHFQLLHGNMVMWHHTMYRPGTQSFLRNISRLYEMHICSFGARMYAHTVAKFIDPEGKYFSHRILSRDECFSASQKTANLKSLFPCGDSMVCIIDDREDVWNYATNLIHVKPYTFFRGTADINAPQCADKGGAAESGKKEKMPARKTKIVKVPRKKISEEPDVSRNKIKSKPSRESESCGKADTNTEGLTEGNKLDKTSESERDTAKTELTEVTKKESEGGTETERQQTTDISTDEITTDQAEQACDKEKSGLDEIKRGDTRQESVSEKIENADIKQECGTGKIEKADAKESGMDNIEVKEERGTVKIEKADVKESRMDSLETSGVKEERGTVKIEKADVKESHMDSLETSGVKEERGTVKIEKADVKESHMDSLETSGVKEESGTDKIDKSDVSDEKDLDKEAKPSNGVQTLKNSIKDSGNASGDDGVASSVVEKMETNTVQSQETQEDDDYEEMIEWEDEDDYLLYLENVLQQIHTAFYKVHDQLKAASGDPGPDLKSIIPYVRKKVLKCCNIVFSGMFPTNLPPEKSRAYCVATSLGATIQPVLVARDDNDKNNALATTHMVAARLGTSKVNVAAKMTGVHVVNANWLWCCAERWERVDERLFVLSTETSVSYSCNSPDVVKQQRSGGKRKEPEDHVALSVYDPVTGKRIYNKRAKPNESTDNGDDASIAGDVNVAMPSTSSKQDDGLSSPSTSSKREERFSESYNPLYAFSKDEIASMDKEVEEIFDESESSDSETELRQKVLGHSGRDSSSSEADSLSGEFPRGWKNKRCKRKAEDEEGEEGSDGENVQGRVGDNTQDTSEDEDDFKDSIGSVDEEMAAAVEKEFLSM